MRFSNACWGGPAHWRLTLGVVAAGSAYCVIYNAAYGAPEPPLHALGWALANLAPWCFAFEAAKALTSDRSARAPVAGLTVAAIFAVTVLASLAIERAVAPWAGEPVTAAVEFRIVRRLPAVAFVLGLLVAARVLRRTRLDRAERRSDAVPIGELPIPPEHIERVSAAGNYVELHSRGRRVLHRLTMHEAEALLGPKGFVRIHRSTLVNRARIARVLGGKAPAEVKLDDGTRLPVGGRYRAALAPNSPTR